MESTVIVLLAALSALAVPADAQYAIAVDESAGPNAPGSMVIEWSLPMDPTTLSSGIVVEQMQAGVGWVRLPPDEVVVGTPPGEEDSSDILVMLRSGWPRGMSYRIRLLPELADKLGRPFGKTDVLEWSVPVATPENPAPAVAYERTFPTKFDSAEAAANTVGGRFPGGQAMLFHGMMHDPVTGLAYARNRWYDPRNGVFLSEDPAGPVDSPNLYAYVGWQPTMSTDPLGLYQQDFHLGMTEYLAREAGFSRLTARVVALSAERPDEDERDPLVTGRVLRTSALYPEAREHEAARSIRRWHFPVTCPSGQEAPGQCAVIPASAQAMAETQRGIEAGSLRRFAEGLHVLQDSFSHQGIPGWHYQDASAGVYAGYGHPDTRGGPWRTTADLPPEFPADTMAAATATFEALLQWRIQREGLSEASAAALRQRFNSELRPRIAEWTALPSREAREAWLQERGILVEDEP